MTFLNEIFPLKWHKLHTFRTLDDVRAHLNNIKHKMHTSSTKLKSGSSVCERVEKCQNLISIKSKFSADFCLLSMSQKLELPQKLSIKDSSSWCASTPALSSTKSWRDTGKFFPASNPGNYNIRQTHTLHDEHKNWSMTIVQKWRQNCNVGIGNPVWRSSQRHQVWQSPTSCIS